MSADIESEIDDELDPESFAMKKSVALESSDNATLIIGLGIDKN